jgi:hypothetical protein
MKRTLIRYKTKPDMAGENARLIKDVFRALQAKMPDGVRYGVLSLGDGTFVHVVETEDGAGPLTGLEAFQSFQSGIKDRCLELPQSGEAVIVGNYRMFGT